MFISLLKFFSIFVVVRSFRQPFALSWGCWGEGLRTKRMIRGRPGHRRGVPSLSLFTPHPHSTPRRCREGGGAEVAKPPHWKVHRMYTRNEDTECTAAFALDCNRVGCRVGLRVCVCVCVYNTVYEDHDDDGACGPLPERPVFVRSVIYVLV